jgi:hypothetical protein
MLRDLRRASRAGGLVDAVDGWPRHMPMELLDGIGRHEPAPADLLGSQTTTANAFLRPAEHGAAVRAGRAGDLRPKLCGFLNRQFAGGSCHGFTCFEKLVSLVQHELNMRESSPKTRIAASSGREFFASGCGCDATGCRCETSRGAMATAQQKNRRPFGRRLVRSRR